MSSLGAPAPGGNGIQLWSGQLQVVSAFGLNVLTVTDNLIVIGNPTDNPGFVVQGSGGAFFNGTVNVSAKAVGGLVQGLVANNDGANNVEVAISSSAAGDATVRTVALGVTNWSFGTQRSTGHFVLSPTTSLAGGVWTLNTSGDVSESSSSGDLQHTMHAGAAQAVTLSLQGNNATFGTRDLLIQQDATGTVFFNNNANASIIMKVNGTPVLQMSATKPNVTGSKGGNAALASLLSALVSLGLLTDSTT